MHWIAYGIRILKCSTTPQLKVWARIYSNLSGNLVENVVQHLREWCGGTSIPKIAKVKPTITSLMGQVGSPSPSTQTIYVDGWDVESNIKQQNYGSFKLLGAPTPEIKQKYQHGPTLIRKIKCYLTKGYVPCAKSHNVATFVSAPSLSWLFLDSSKGHKHSPFAFRHAND